MAPKRTFEEYMKLVDAELIKLCGLTHMDLSDIAYRDCYDDGVPPKSAAKRAYKASMD